MKLPSLSPVKIRPDAVDVTPPDRAIPRWLAPDLSGTDIEGGSSRAIAKGDFVIVPENTPPWFSAINGTLIVMSLHVPRSGATY